MEIWIYVATGLQCYYHATASLINIAEVYGRNTQKHFIHVFSLFLVINEHAMVYVAGILFASYDFFS